MLLRTEAVQQIFDDRKGNFVTPLAQTAFVLDPRMRGLLPPDASTNDTMGFNFEEAWQQALATALNAYFPRFFRNEAELEEAKRHFGDFTEVKGTFMECPALPLSATFREMVEWWSTSQPSYLLKRLALHVFSVQASQGACERGWALISRH